MSFKSRRGATSRREAASSRTPIAVAAAAVEDDAADVVIRKDRNVKRSVGPRQARPSFDQDDERPVLMTASSSTLYSNGGLEQLRKEQSRITNTCMSYDRMEMDTDDAPLTTKQAQIPTEQSIAAAKLKRQQLRQNGSAAAAAAAAPQYIPLQNSDQPVAVAGGLYGIGSGTSTLVREEDDDEVPNLLQPVPKAPLSTVLDDIEEDDHYVGDGSPMSGSAMTISEAEIQMAIVTRLEECRADSAARTRESVQINDRLSVLNSEHESITNQISKAEEKYIGLQQLYATVSSLLECVSGKAQIIDQLWEEYCSLRHDRHRHSNQVISLHWSDQDQPTSPDNVQESDNAADAVQIRRRVRSRQRRSVKAQANETWMEGWTTYGDTDVERESLQLMMEMDHQAGQVFVDVIDQFSNVDSVLEIFQKWKDLYREEYDNAYCDLSLPRLLLPYIKVILIRTRVSSSSGLALLIAATTSIRAFSPSVMDSLVSALIGPFLTTTLMQDFSPFSMRDMIRCRAFCERIREHFASVEIATSLRMLFVQADDKRQRGRRLGSNRHWGRSLKLLFSMKSLEQYLGPESQFMITAVVTELQQMVSTERRSKQLASVLQGDLIKMSNQ